MTAPIHVLLVDDEAEFAVSVAKVLRRRGLEVTVAPDGDAALAAVIRTAFDAILLDVKLPGRDGLEVLGEMKRLTPETQIILLTGHLSVTEEQDGLRCGAFAYLLKPHPLPALVDRITAAAAATRGRRGTVAAKGGT